MKENRTGSYADLIAAAGEPVAPLGLLRRPDDDAVVPVFIPALVAILLNRERAKGNPLTETEVLSIRDASNCLTMRRSMARELAESRGYDDIDPEDAWAQWQSIRGQFSASSSDAE